MLSVIPLCEVRLPKNFFFVYCDQTIKALYELCMQEQATEASAMQYPDLHFITSDCLKETPGLSWWNDEVSLDLLTEAELSFKAKLNFCSMGLIHFIQLVITPDVPQDQKR